MAVIAAILLISAVVAGYVGFSGSVGRTGTSTTGISTTTSITGNGTATITSPTTSSSITTTSASTCATATPAKDQELSNVTFDAITEYALSPNRTPAGFALAPDGSVWFGEWGLPGVGHLYPNGTLTEYKWPYSDDSGVSFCGMETNIWGVALWNGSVWGADNYYSRLVGVNPATGQTQDIVLANGSAPYTLAASPGGDLWFTQISTPAKLGEVSPTSHTVRYYDIPNGKDNETAYLLFPNSTTGYVLTIDTVTDTAQIYSFNPTSGSPVFTPVGGILADQELYAPSSLAVGEGGIWATEHSASAMAFLNFTTQQWTIYPTSTVAYTPWILTYFDASNGTTVWFNEHYGNKMGVISDNGSMLTEYSVSNPPTDNFTEILEDINAVTMGPAQDGAWFAAATAGYVGFVNGSYIPPFGLSLAGGGHNDSIQLGPGQSKQVLVQLTTKAGVGNLSLRFSDNEFNNGTAKEITFNSNVTAVPSTVNGTMGLSITIAGSSGVRPGDYLGALTVTNGLIYRTVYIHIVVVATG